MSDGIFTIQSNDIPDPKPKARNSTHLLADCSRAEQDAFVFKPTDNLLDGIAQ